MDPARDLPAERVTSATPLAGTLEAMPDPREHHPKVAEIHASLGPDRAEAGRQLFLDTLRARGVVPRQLSPEEEAEIDARIKAADEEAQRFWAEHRSVA